MPINHIGDHRGVKNPSYKHGNYLKVTIFCSYCQRPIIRRINRIKEFNCCNKSCALKYQWAYQSRIDKTCRGKNHPWYVNGSAMYLQRDTPQWNKIRCAIYKRDNWTCQNCGATHVKVSAHHIIPYRVSKDNSLKNLITLCNKCHIKQDLKYRRENEYKLNYVY